MEPVKHVMVIKENNTALPALFESFVNAGRSKGMIHVSTSLHHKVWRLLPTCADRLHRIPETWGRESAEANDGCLEKDASIPFVWLCIFGLLVICRWIILCDGEMFRRFSHDDRHACVADKYTPNREKSSNACS